MTEQSKCCQSKKRIIIGIDPGLHVTGYGVIWSKNSQQGCITFGQITPQSKSLNCRLHQIEEGLCDIIASYQPEEAAIEKIFTFRNHQSALTLGQARGVALSATASVCILPTAEYSARQIKKTVVGYGAATKAQVQYMIRMLLQLEKIPSADAADALATAVCHARFPFDQKTDTYTKKISSVAKEVLEVKFFN
ncbi:crossover junction endodeoxyribonuclease RuvC [Coxiella endosymbiont of Amblyomma sculptum]|uniref:crossover junction endodeoxyribonuclease RuvC n=1 Tax=Coxiella endosymbiont of Amblyomma sculptum TaxID=2487929 RepID=UPI00132EAAE2|nr:crossover junction endodeoxyribonuclease RuvC [Coxiella endosymbiont of Amblyomma sculptum]QHG92279.1 crossover junction endodeoxyribonuclease RuvC [Coxiella endosymbiont of Amblyomma sculptum]